jgi:hypothetical protein
VQQPYLSFSLLSVRSWHTQVLFPVTSLLVGTVLVILARIRSRNQSGLLRSDRCSAASC